MMMSRKNGSYEPPELSKIGSVEDITGADVEGSGDGGGLKPGGSL